MHLKFRYRPVIDDKNVSKNAAIIFNHVSSPKLTKLEVNDYQNSSQLALPLTSMAESTFKISMHLK